MAIDFRTSVGQVRLLIADVDEAREVLSDDVIEGFLALYGAEPYPAPADPVKSRRAAADALDAIAISEALVSKVIKTQDLSTDGTKVAEILRAQAVRLREDADRLLEESLEEDAGAFFGVVEFSPRGSYGPEATERRWF